MTDILAMLGGLARADAQAGNPSASGALFEGVFWSLAFEAEVYKLGLPVHGYGFNSRPVGTPDEIAEALSRYLKDGP